MVVPTRTPIQGRKVALNLLFDIWGLTQWIFNLIPNMRKLTMMNDADATSDNDTNGMYKDFNETEGVDNNVSIFERSF